MRYIYDYYTDPGGRPENEDAVSVTSFGNNVVAVVADGLGGQGDGGAASSIICSSLMHCGENDVFPTEIVLADAFNQANDELIKNQSNRFHMKSTAVYLCIQGNMAIWGYVGDSRLYHLYEGKICEYTLDHSASQLAVFMGRISREDIPGDAGRNRLLRAMGVEDTQPDIHEAVRLLSGRHGFLLCSDGLWEYLTDSEIENAFIQSTTASACIRTLRRLRESRCPPDCDNNSAVAILLEV